MESRSAKSSCANLLEAIADKEKRLAAQQIEQRAKQSTAGQLRLCVDEKAPLVEGISKAVTELQAKYESMLSEMEKNKKQVMLFEKSQHICRIQTGKQSCSERFEFITERQ